MFRDLKIQTTAESVSGVFARYIYDAIRKYPILNQPTKLDFGSARIIVLNLQEVAPTGSAASNRQTEMMYLLGPSHSCPQLLPAARLRPLRSGSRQALPRQALPRGLRDRQKARL